MATPSIIPTRSILPVMQHAADGAAVCTTLAIAQYLLGQPMNDRTWIAGLVGSVVYFLFAELLGLYRSGRMRAPDVELIGIVVAWLGTLTTLSGIGFLTRIADTFSRSSVIAWFVLAGLVLAFSRMFFRSILELLAKKGIGAKRCAIAGVNTLGVQLAQNAALHPECGLKIVGFFDDREPDRRVVIPDNMPAFSGSLNAMIDLAKAGEIDTVLLTLPMKAENRMRHILKELSDTTVSAYIVPDFFVFELLHSRWTEVGGLPVVSVFESPMYGVDGWMKRLLDICVASAALIFAAPLMLIIALLVRCTSPGPVFFLQKRYGLDGKEILVWKFRSMRVCENGNVVKQAQRNDPRVTAIGAILRKTSLDELPQLFNVIGGSMSLVGPRPLANAHNEYYRRLIQGYMLRHKVRPGITGLAQVEGSRGETDTVEKMQFRIDLDHRYIREWSMWLDLKILFKTIWVVFKQQNAY